jgi:hypothetical protein
MSDQLIPIRLSHLLGHSGVGAIVRGANGLMVVQDIRQWTDRHGADAGKPIPYVERVRAALGIDQELREPPVAKELSSGLVDGVCVPASRFPTWTHCPAPKCGTLYRWPWSHSSPGQEPHCNQEECKGPKLEQVTWVMADPEGYLADVPWHFLTHRGARAPHQSHCKVTDKLRLIERGHEALNLHCDACGVTSSFRGDERLVFGHGRMQPWTKDDLVQPSVEIESNEKNFAQILAINDSRVYSPHTESVLVIPPESRVRKGTVVDRLYRNSGDRARIDGARNPLARKSAIRTLATDYRCAPADIETALDDLNRGYPLYGENLTGGQMRESEFKAFLEILPDQRDDEDLVTSNHSNEWHELGQASELNTELRTRLAGIEHLVQVDRLKSVRVFKGFSRLAEDNIVPPDIVGQSGWLPAIEMYGEGIFITLDETRLCAWEQNPAVTERLNQLLPRFAQSGRDEPNPLTTRFLLLHTLSHLLMRQIESEGGYPAASLSERLYCANSPEPMAGILIHVSVPDIAGSLGGLAELAEPQRFLGILTRALEHSNWCSLDPVCSEHEGQGPGLLNRAACHACALVPDPSCEYGNILLDRGFVKGDADSGLPAFFGMQ